MWMEMMDSGVKKSTHRCACVRAHLHKHVAQQQKYAETPQTCPKLAALFTHQKTEKLRLFVEL